MSELTDRMRTCAEFLQTCDLLGDLELRNDVSEYKAVHNAIELLREAATELENPPVVLQPWVPIEAPTPSEGARVAPEKTVQEWLIASDLSGAAWIDPGVPDLPTQPLNKNACPKCDSRATKKVHATKSGFRLECRVCGHTWKR